MSTEGDIDDPSREGNTSGVSSEDSDTRKWLMKPRNASASERERLKQTEEDNLPRKTQDELNDPAGGTDALRDTEISRR